MFTFGTRLEGVRLRILLSLTVLLTGRLAPRRLKMIGKYALLSLVYMMSFVILFDRVHYKHKIFSWLRGGNLMERGRTGTNSGNLVRVPGVIQLPNPARFGY